MSNKSGFIIIIIICAVGAIIWSANSRINKATNAVNEEIRAQDYPAAQGLSAAVAQYGLAEAKPAVTVVGATPVEQRAPAFVQQEKSSAGAFRPQGSPFGASSNLKQGEPEPSTPPLTGITVKKEPANNEKMTMDKNGIIIF